ncbi:MAG TPA: dockerin type I domain-containing protein [Chthoniobacterales bacterium]
MNLQDMVRRFLVLSAVVGTLGYASTTKADRATFTFAPVGSSFSAALLGGDPLIGKEIVSARIYLDVESFAGSDAANFFTDTSFPIEPFPGNTNAVVLAGADLGWSGEGTFHYFEETARFNGVFAAYRYGGETPGENFDGVILGTSRIEFDYITAGGADLTLESAASRRTHGNIGEFDVDLPLTGDIGIEPRAGNGKGEIVFTFNNNVTGASGVTSSCGKVGPVMVDPDDAHSLSVSLSELGCNHNTVTVTLSGVQDDQGNTLDSAAITFGILFGDVNGDRVVNNADIAATRAVQGQRTKRSNLRSDINTDGGINNKDVGEVKSHRGEILP